MDKAIKTEYRAFVEDKLLDGREEGLTGVDRREVRVRMRKKKVEEKVKKPKAEASGAWFEEGFCF